MRTDDLSDEPKITINGVDLTPTQALTIRVALGHFDMSLSSIGLGADEHGRAMTANYHRLIDEINRVIFQRRPSERPLRKG
jgi:hypothetical protein